MQDLFRIFFYYSSVITLLFMRCMTSNGICRGFAFKYGKFPLPLRYRTALSVPKVSTMYSNYVVYKMNTLYAK